MKEQQEDDFLKEIFEEINTCITNDSGEYKNSQIKKTYCRLLKENHNKDDIIDLIASVIISEPLFFFKSSGSELLNDRFHKNLNNLPKPPSPNPK